MRLLHIRIPRSMTFLRYLRLFKALSPQRDDPVLLVQVNQAAFGIAGLPPSAIALPSLAKKSMPPPPPPRDDAEEDGDDEEEEENGAAAYVDDLPDPLDDTPQLPAVKRGKPSGGRGALPPPPPKLGGGDEEDESDWTEDDSEDEREVLALDVDLPDFSNEP